MGMTELVILPRSEQAYTTLHIGDPAQAARLQAGAEKIKLPGNESESGVQKQGDMMTNYV